MVDKLDLICVSKAIAGSKVSDCVNLRIEKGEIVTLP